MDKSRQKEVYRFTDTEKRKLMNDRQIYLWLSVEAPETLILPMVGLPL